MPKEPDNPTTWQDIKDQVADIRAAVDALDPPPVPSEELGQATFRLRQACETIEQTVEAMIRREEGEE